MTPADIVAIFAGASALVVAIGTAIVNIIAINRVSAKADVITTHVNSAAQAAVAKIESLQRQVESLTARISEQKQDAALLAQAAVASDTVPIAALTFEKR